MPSFEVYSELSTPFRDQIYAPESGGSRASILSFSTIAPAFDKVTKCPYLPRTEVVPRGLQY